MGFVYPDCDFGLDVKPHPEHEKLKQDVQDWLVDTKIVEPAEISNYVNKSIYGSYCFADSPYSERLVLVNKWSALLWIADNQLRDEVAPSEANRKKHEEFVQVCRDGRTNSESRLMQEFATIQNRIQELSDPDWYEFWSYSNYQGAKWQHEMVFERKLTKPDMATSMVGRNLDGCLFSFISLHEFLDENYLPLRVRTNPVYFMLLTYATESGTVFNDYIGWEKELGEENVYRVFRAIQAKKKLTNDQFQEVSDEIREIVMDAFDKFIALANRIDDLFKEEDVKLMQTVVKRVHRFIQGNKDFHFMCPGYINENAIITYCNKSEP